MVTLKTQGFGVMSLNLLGRWLPMWMMIFSQTGTELSLGHWWRQYELCVSHSDLRSHHSDCLSGTWPHPPHVPTCTVHITQASWVVPSPPPHPQVPTCTAHITQAYRVVPVHRPILRCPPVHSSHHSGLPSGTRPTTPSSGAHRCTAHITQAYRVVPGPLPHPQVPTHTFHPHTHGWT